MTCRRAANYRSPDEVTQYRLGLRHAVLANHKNRWPVEQIRWAVNDLASFIGDSR